MRSETFKCAHRGMRPRRCSGRELGSPALFVSILCALRYSPAPARSLIFGGMAANKITAEHLGLLTALAKPDTKPSRRRAFGGFFPRAAQQPHAIRCSETKPMPRAWRHRRHGCRQLVVDNS